MHGGESYITTASGRRVGFVQCGDLSGYPIIVMHGWPATRISSAIYHDRAKRMGVRIIAPDRPGFGISGFQPARRLLDWPKDVEAIANHLGIARFAVLGVSGGAASAFACAHALPRRVTRLGIVAGGGGVAHKMDWQSKMASIFMSIGIVRLMLVGLMYLNARYGWGVMAYRFLWGKRDRRLYRNQLLVDRGNRTILEAFASGIAGPAWEMKLINQDWGFDLAKITTPTYLWYGNEDHNVVKQCGQYFRTTLRNNVYKEYKHEGHLVSETRGEVIIKTLAGL